MLTPLPLRLHMPSRQRGVVLLITLIMLVAMTLAAIAMMRSVDTANMVAGNLAFEQSAVHAADVGTEQAISYLYTVYPNRKCGTVATNLCPAGYQSFRQAAAEPPAVESWDRFWASRVGAPGVVALANLPSGYSGAFVIEAMCDTPGQMGCYTATSTTTVTTPQGEDMGSTNRDFSSTTVTATVIYYRITTRVEGPRNSVGYVQVMVAL